MPYNVIFSEDNDSLQDRINAIITDTLLYLKYPNENAIVSVSIVSPEEIQQLNKQYRNVDKPTNVLSFPNCGDILGDVVLCNEVITKEAEEQGKTFENHLTHLVIHSILHLLGYDHMSDKEAEKMEALEIEILSKVFNIANPYE